MAISFVGVGGHSASVLPTMPAPANPSGLAAGDLKVLLVATRGTAEWAVTGWDLVIELRDGVKNVASITVFVRNHQVGDAAPVLTQTGGGVPNEAIITQIAAWRGVRLEGVFGFGGAFVGDVANIGPIPGNSVPPGGLALFFGARSDDWTSVATLPGSFVEVGEPDTTFGDDLGMVWNYLINTSSFTNIIADQTFTVTGGVQSMSVGTSIVFAPNVDGNQATGLGGMSSSMSGGETFAGNKGAQLGSMSGSQSGTNFQNVDGNMASQLGTMFGSQSGTVLSPVDGNMASQLGAMSGNQSGTEEFAGEAAASQLGAMSGDQSGTEEFAGDQASQLGAMSGAQEGEVNVDGVMSSSFAPLTGSMEGAEEFVGDMGSTLGSLGGAMSGETMWSWTFQAAVISPVLQAIDGNDGNVPVWWTIAENSTLLRQELRRSTSRFPTTPTEGELVFSDEGQSRYFLDEDVENGVTYFYTLFVVVQIVNDTPVYVAYDPVSSDDGTPRHIPLFTQTTEEYVPMRGEMGAVRFPLPLASNQVWGQLTARGRDDRDIVKARRGTHVTCPVSGVVAAIDESANGLKTIIIDTDKGGFRFVLGQVTPHASVASGRRVRVGEVLGNVGGSEMELSIIKLPVGRFGHRTVRPTYLFLSPEARDGRRKG